MNYPSLKQAATKKKSEKNSLTEEQVEALLREQGGKDLLSTLFTTPSAYRAMGRASQLDESFGRDTQWRTRYPKTFNRLGGIAGALGGSIAGGLLGGGLGALTQGFATGDMSLDAYGDANPISPSLGAARGGALGALAGTALGGVAGALTTRLMQRQALRKAREQALADVESGAEGTSEATPGNWLAGLVSGVHQQGRADVVEALRDGKSDFGYDFQHPGMLTAQMGAVPATALDLVAPGVGSLTAGLLGAGHAVGSLSNLSQARGRLRG